MTTANIGIRSGNAVIPFASATKRTKWITVTDASHITITGTGFTSSTIRGAYIRATADSNNVWRLDFNVDVTKAAGTGARTSATLTFASPYAVTFRNITQFFQACAAFDDTSGSAITAEANPNASTVTLFHASADIAQYSVSGACILESEPTWAAANMEGVVAADVYIAPASVSVAGLVDTSAQTFAGPKTLTGFTSLGGDLGVKMKILTGTTPSGSGGTTNIAHGLTSTKVIGGQVLIEYGTGAIKT